MDLDLSGLVDDFRSEALDCLQRIGDLTVALEKISDPEEFKTASHAAFRAAHNVKGTAATFGFKRVSELMHALEDLLGALRDGVVSTTPETTDTILQTVDAMVTVIHEVEQGNSDLLDRDLDTLRRLKSLLPVEATDDVASSSPARPASSPRGPAADPAPLHNGKSPAVSPIAAKEGSAVSSPGRPLDAEFVRISHRSLDNLLGHMGELSEVEIMLDSMRRSLGELDEELIRLPEEHRHASRDLLMKLDNRLEHELQNVNKLLSGIQGELQTLRMVPFKTIFPVLRRALREVSRARDVDVELQLGGGDYELDRKVIEHVKAPLVHLIRNAVDHGVEHEEERLQAGKNARARVGVHVFHHGSSVRIEVSDDGRGFDTEKILEQALERGEAVPSDRAPSNSQIMKLLFTPGFSTASRPDEISGRGVGLDAIRRDIEALQGHVDAESCRGRGTTFRLTVPLTLATDSGLFVIAGGQRFVLPSASVEWVTNLSGGDVSFVEGIANFWCEGRPLPLFRLAADSHLISYAENTSQRYREVVVVRCASSSVAVAVDEIEGESEIIVRNLGSFLSSVEGLSGFTVGSSGDTYFVLNPQDLVTSITPNASIGATLPSVIDADTRGVNDRLILVADDSLTSRSLSEKMLLASGFRVVTAADGSIALDMLHQQPFDLVLTDVQMPNMDGYELTRRIREDADLMSIPVVVLTSLDRKEDRERGLEAGASAYLVKSELTPTVLLTTVEQLCS